MALLDEFLEQLRAHAPLSAVTHLSRPRYCSGSTAEIFDALAGLARAGTALTIKQLSVMTPDRLKMMTLHTRMPQMAPSAEIVRRGDALKSIKGIKLSRLILTGSSRDAAELKPWAESAGAALVGISSIQQRQLLEEHFHYCDHILINGSILLASRHIDDSKQRDDWLLLPSGSAKNFNELWSNLEAELRQPEHVALEIAPLWRSADFAYELANVVCHGSSVDPAGCSWYHGSWQYLRLADKVSSPFWHEDFFRRTLKYCLDRQGSPAILVSGCADYGMLSLVIDELRKSGSASHSVIYVVDQCRTPLTLCEWLLRNMDHAHVPEVRRIQADMRGATRQSLELDRPVDIIVTDAFLTRFQKSDSASVIKAWREILTPAGTILTTIRVHDKSSTTEDRDLQLSNYAAAAMRRLRPWKPFLRISDTELSEVVYDYGRSMRSENLGNTEEVIAMLTENMLFAYEHEVANVQGELESARYVRLVLGSPAAIHSRRTVEHASTIAMWRPTHSSDATEHAKEAIPHLYNALHRQTEADPSWAGNLGSATFAAHAHAALGDTESWQKISAWVRGAWQVLPKDLPRPSTTPSTEYADFKEIVDRIKAIRGTALDLDRFHRSYVLALLLNFEGDSPVPDEQRVAYLLQALKLEVEKEGTGLLYPSSVPWVTARALIGLSRLQSSSLVTDASVVDRIRDALLERANAGWAPGTAGWNTKAQTTALTATAVQISGIAETNPAIIQAIDEIVALYGNEWSATIDVLDCCDCLYALSLAGRSLSQFSSDFSSLLRWACREESMAVPAEESVSHGEESSKIPQVLSVLLDLIRLDPSLAGSLSGLLPTDVREGRDDSAEMEERLEGIIADAAELQEIARNRLAERKIDLAGLAHPPAVLDSGIQRLTQLSSELEQAASEARALKTATGDRSQAAQDLRERVDGISGRLNRNRRAK